MRKVYAARRAALTDALGAHSPHLRLTGLDAGFHALATLPDGADEESIVAAAAQRGVHLQGLGRYRSPGRTGPAAIVFGFGDLNDSAIRRGVARIADLLQP